MGAQAGLLMDKPTGGNLTMIEEKLVELYEKEGSMPTEVFQVTFQNPEPQYYDGRFSTFFESCLKDKFEGLEEINEIPSNYVSQSLKDYNIESKKFYGL
jgi:hypothetical protein